MNNYHKPTKEETDKVRLRTDEIQDIVGIVPKWFVRYGISVIFAFLCIIIIGCWFFKYPDIVSARVDITINNPPADIIAKATGKIEKVFVSDNEKVNKNNILAIIENVADYNEAFEMKVMITNLLNDNSGSPGINFTKLGDLQAPYSLYLKQYNDYKNFVSLNYHSKKLETIKAEIGQQQTYLANLSNRFTNTKEQLALAKKQFLRDSLLYQQEVIALTDFEKSQNTYLQSKNSCESARTTLMDTEIQITRLQQTMLDLESQRMEQTSQQKNALKESFDVLSARIREWENLYILKAPTDGKVTFTRFWTKNQNIKTGDIVFTIVPADSNTFIAKIQLPIQSSGKVKTGQKVIIKLDDYPYMEYGFIHTRINKISLVPFDGFYYAEAPLPRKLITSYGTNISAKKELKGNGEIIVKDQRLLYRFMLPFKAAIDKNRLE